jgi:hypothetical protein
MKLLQSTAEGLDRQEVSVQGPALEMAEGKVQIFSWKGASRHGHATAFLLVPEWAVRDLKAEHLVDRALLAQDSPSRFAPGEASG